MRYGSGRCFCSSQGLFRIDCRNFDIVEDDFQRLEGSRYIGRTLTRCLDIRTANIELPYAQNQTSMNKSRAHLAEYFVLPKSHGTYLFTELASYIILILHHLCLQTHLYLIILCICLLIVKNTKINQYTTNTGQNTGRLKISLQLHRNASPIARVAACQNLNSGSRRTKGLNSWSAFVGRELDWPAGTPSSMSVSLSRLGSNFGLMKARKRFRR